MKIGLVKPVISYHKHKLNPILIHYIYHKSEKGKPRKKDLPLLKKRYHTEFLEMIRVFYRYLFSWNGLIINKKNVV